MILIDYSAISLAAIVANLARERANTMEIPYGQHLILNSLKHFIKMFQGKMGYAVICCDSHNSWRKKYFEHYKAARAAGRDSSPLDWETIFKITDSVRESLAEYFPVFVAKKDTYEADDLIAAFALNYDQPTVICSEDKDFYQLLHKPNLWIYHNRRKTFYEGPYLNNKDVQDFMDSKFRNKKIYTYTKTAKGWAEAVLLEQIIRGDGIDGVPNMLSDDDTYMTNKRSVPITAKKLNRLQYIITNGEEKELSRQEQLNYQRNKRLIDLHPMAEECKDVVESIIAQEKPKAKLLETQKWLMNNTLVQLANASQEFYQKVTAL